MLLVDDRLPQILPPHLRHLPTKDTIPKVVDPLRVRDTRFLLLMVTGYVLAMLGGVLLLNVLSPITHTSLNFTAASDVKAADK